jgi:hypothetical protein
MADMVDFRQEARGCIERAKAESHAELRTILMGMALGWLKLGRYRQEPLERSYVENEPGIADEPVEEPA